MLKNKIAVHARESEEQNRRVRDDKEIVLKQLQKLKCQMNRARAKARSNLAKLSLESNNTLKTLERVVKKVDIGGHFQALMAQGSFLSQTQKRG